MAKHQEQKMIALTAVMRKLLLLIYSLWKSGQAYDQEFHYQQVIHSLDFLVLLDLSNSQRIKPKEQYKKGR